jgi:hypothetical protein
MERPYHEKAKLEAELAEARAQIAAKDADRQMLWDLHQEFHTAVHQCEKCGEADPMETFDCTRMLDEYLSDEGPQEDLAAVYFERIKTLEREADEARAQIAAKDAMLERCRSYVLNRPDPSNVAERVTLIRDIDNALRSQG